MFLLGSYRRVWSKPQAALPLLAVVLMGNSPETSPATEAEISLARTILDDGLVDYSGSKLRKMHLVEKPNGGRVICGEINAPNHMGGMTGWRGTAIVLDGSDDTPLNMENDRKVMGIPVDSLTVLTLCPTLNGRGESVAVAVGDLTDALSPEPAA